MNLRNGSGTFANGATDAFDGPGANVAHGEHAADARLQWQ
jgi:hypothetical protein